MKKQAIELHKIYAVKIGGAVVPVRLDSENPSGGWSGTNAKNGKAVRVKSAQRLRGLWPKKTLPIVADDVGPKGETAVPADKDATTPAGGDTGERGATGAKKERHSLLNLAAKVLADAGQPLHCKEMVDKVLATGLWTTKGKTPASTLYSALIREIATKGDAARFRKTARGKFEIVTK